MSQSGKKALTQVGAFLHFGATKVPGATMKVNARLTQVAVWLALFLLLFIALTRLTWIETPRQDGFWSFVGEHLEKGFLEAFALACLLTILGKIAFFKTHAEDHLREVIGRDFIEKASDPQSLSRLSVAQLESIESALQQTEFDRTPPDEVSSLLKQLSKFRKGLSTYRSDYSETMTYEEVTGHASCFKLTTEKKYKYHNLRDAAEIATQTLRFSWFSTTDLGEEDYYKLFSFQVDGNDKKGAFEIGAPEQPGGNMVSVTMRVPLLIPRRSSVSIMYRCEMVQLKVQPWVQTFFLPVHGLDITLVHPDYIIPSLFVFGVDEGIATDPLPPFASQKVMHRWKYDGWFVRDQGFVLAFGARS